MLLHQLVIPEGALRTGPGGRPVAQQIERALGLPQPAQAPQGPAELKAFPHDCECRARLAEQLVPRHLDPVQGDLVLARGAEHRQLADDPEAR